jgi:hypothetical protein
MNHISDGMRGLSLILRLNLDRMLFVGALFLALMIATWFAHP